MNLKLMNLLCNDKSNHSVIHTLNNENYVTDNIIIYKENEIFQVYYIYEYNLILLFFK